MTAIESMYTDPAEERAWELLITTLYTLRHEGAESAEGYMSRHNTYDLCHEHGYECGYVAYLGYKKNGGPIPCPLCAVCIEWAVVYGAITGTPAEL
ncbi:MAG TPA: hypothetical protein VKP88_07645 [Candidatus Paceibacterota bacterium]|nr:hypothetical protein [Candidatus Paceibacterota bacterium]